MVEGGPLGLCHRTGFLVEEFVHVVIVSDHSSLLDAYYLSP